MALLESLKDSSSDSMGMVSPVGNDVDTSWESALNSKSGVGEITLYDASEYRVRIAAEVKDFDVSKYVDKRKSVD